MLRPNRTDRRIVLYLVGFLEVRYWCDSRLVDDTDEKIWVRPIAQSRSAKDAQGRSIAGSERKSSVGRCLAPQLTSASHRIRSINSFSGSFQFIESWLPQSKR